MAGKVLSMPLIHFNTNAKCTFVEWFSQIDWCYRWNEIHMLRSVDKGVEVLIGEKQKKVLGLFGSNEQKKKIIQVAQPARRAKLLKIMSELKAHVP